MSDIFQDREKGFERKYALEQDRIFRIKAHRDRLFGLWVAAQLGKSGTEAEIYATKLVLEDIDNRDDKSLIRRVQEYLKSHNIFLDESVLFAQLHQAQVPSSGDIHGAAG